MAKKQSKPPVPMGAVRSAEADAVAGDAKEVKCIAKDHGHAACNCPVCEEGRRNP